jgi:chemotaxis response regulator CheB
VPADLQPIQHGEVLICPYDRHMALENGIVRVYRGVKELGFRPSADVLFRSAALTYGRRVIGVVLSGMLRDGIAGLWHIRQRGGVTIAQDPHDAKYPAMPANAIEQDIVDDILPADAIAAKLVDLAGRQQPGETTHAPNVLIVEDDGIVAKDLAESLHQLGCEVRGPVDSAERAIIVATQTAPDIVLMDIGLRGTTSGIDAARKIWTKLQIPIIYVTGHADSTTITGVQGFENYGYIVKPFHSDAVRVTIRLALDRREREQRHLAPSRRKAGSLNAEPSPFAGGVQ